MDWNTMLCIPSAVHGEVCVGRQHMVSQADGQGRFIFVCTYTQGWPCAEQRLPVYDLWDDLGWNVGW